MKKIAFALGAVALVCSLSSCSKTCSCTISKGDQRLDAYEYADMSRSECDAKVDEVWDELMMTTNTPESLVGVEVACSHF